MTFNGLLWGPHQNGWDSVGFSWILIPFCADPGFHLESVPVVGSELAREGSVGVP